MNAVKDVPVLFLVFNRPDLTLKIFRRIREVRPALLFIAADGPRANHPADIQACEQTRAVVSNVDWPCKVKTLFREENLGCRSAVESAITWFFEQVEAGIILEDDCLPDSSFFQFCAELLERYRDDERVMSISGDYFGEKEFVCGASYSYSIYHHIWGWATWRRAWRHYNPSLAIKSALLDLTWLSHLLESDEAAQYWNNIINHYRNGLFDTWDYPWLFSCWENNGVSIVPYVNLVTNIGFGPRGTHTQTISSPVANLPASAMCFPLRHPSTVKRNRTVESTSQELFFSSGKRSAKSSSSFAFLRRFFP